MWSWAICLGAILCLLHKADTSDLFKEDGVLVNSQGEARTVSAVWQLVVLATPPARPPVDAWIASIHDCVDKLTASRWFDNVNHWDRKLEIIQARVNQEPEVTQSVSLSRRKRGLLNIVGSAASWLFGTVSQEQLDSVRDTLATNSLRSKALQHNQDQMLTVMNKTRHFQIRLAQHITVVERLVRAAQMEAEEMDETLSDVLLLVKIRIAVEEVESVVRTFTEQKAQHHRDMMQLERGMLTEDLLPRGVLSAVLSRVRAAGWEPLPMHWYYQFTRVLPVWGREETVAFSVGLQTTGTDRFEIYELRYLPVIFDAEHLRTVIGEPRVAVGAHTRTNFYPTTCMGEFPTVCLPSVEFTKESCEAALVVGADPKSCTIGIKKIGEESATILAPTEGSAEVVIAPHKTNIEVITRCIGKPQTYTTVSFPMILTIPEACYFEGEGWMLKGMAVHQETLNVQVLVPEVNLPRLNISWPSTLHPKLKEQLGGLSELHIPVMSFTNIVPVPRELRIQKHLSTFMYTLIAVAGVLLVGMIMYVSCRCRTFWRRRRQQSQTLVRQGNYFPEERGTELEHEVILGKVKTCNSIQLKETEICNDPPVSIQDTVVKYVPRKV